MIPLIRRLLGLGPDTVRPTGAMKRERLVYTSSPTVCYCIGDVHGRLDLLKQMEAKIICDSAAFSGEKWIVLLGDLIDRGPSSAQVIDHVLAPPPPGFERFCLVGNHEGGMLQFLNDADRHSWWLEHGGLETLASYNIDTGRIIDERSSNTDRRYLTLSHVPNEHIEFLRSLPVLIETPSWIFVHAGLEPGRPLARQSDDTLVWYRDDFVPSFAEWQKLVVHGHTPREEVFLSANRIAVDTGACLTGRLSAVRLVQGSMPLVIEASGRPV